LVPFWTLCLPPGASAPPAPPQPEGTAMPTTAPRIARRYDEYVSAVWRGDRDVTRFADWLTGCWRMGGPPEPPGPPDAVSHLGAAGAGIRWHQTPTTVFGYIPGVRDRCYQVPVNADPPELERRTAVRSRKSDAVGPRRPPDIEPPTTVPPPYADGSPVAPSPDC
jgi:hypothetical protein